MSLPVVYHPQVFNQIRLILDWYEDKQKGLGDIFLAELDKTIKTVQQNPKSFPKKFRNSRQLKLGKFPYVLVYEIHPAVIEIYNIIHTSRHPIRRIIKK